MSKYWQPLMKLINATKQDLPLMMHIIKDAQDLLAEQNIDQWQNGYPTEKILLNDIQNNESYIIKSDNNTPIATAMFSLRGEPTYSKIEGQWMRDNQRSYGVIHRMAVSKEFRGKGIAKFIFKEREEFLFASKIKSMRIDTHQDNTGMLSLLKHLKYSYCGVIYLQNGDKRLAFEKLIK